MNSFVERWQSYFIAGILVIVVCMTFTSITLPLAIIFGNWAIGLYIEQGISAFLLVLQVYCLFKRKHSRYVYLFLAIAIWQIIIYLAKGYGIMSVFQSFSHFGIFLIYLAWFEKGGWTRRGIIKIFLAAVSVNFLFVVLEFLDVTSHLVDKYTIYGDLNTQNGYRYTGLFVAPGLLGFFSTFMAIYGAADYKINRDYLGLLVCIIAVFLGVSSGNRSFILAAIFGLLTVYLWRPRFPNYKKTKRIYSTTMIAIIISLIVTPLLVYQDEIQFILDRFLWETLLTDIMYRTQGSAGFLPVLESLGTASSIFGTTSIDPEFGNNRVLLDGASYSLSNSYAALLATKGWLFGGAYLMLFVGALIKYRSFSKSFIYNELSIIGSSIYFGMLAASVFLLFDNLIEGIMMQAIVMLAYSRMWRQDQQDL